MECGNGAGPAANQIILPKDIYLDKHGVIYVLDVDKVKKFPAGSNSASNGVTVAGGNGQGKNPGLGWLVGRVGFGLGV